ncbi:Integral membrane protein [Trichophyton interdigitale]|uniref:Integral membrane protein n=1 Tax=Trichophyton interdigitale TaxID=101480 RepID=A0A9P5CZ08_9EURO|nr:Integral membrane protein [Trichophyton interdigitale]KAF3898509.1 Integral membrane protein [Trichophyton interdigitale]KAG8210529.1 Integral membrane protein [Trichophyton interdigitale]
MAMSGPDYLGTTVLVVAWVFAGLASIVVGTRYYVRWRIIGKFTIDDALIFVAYAFGIGNSVFLTISTHWGLGTHMAKLSEEGIMHSVKWVYLCEFFSIMSPGIGRIAYASLLLGLLPPIKWRSRMLWSLIWIQFIVDIATVIISFSQCRPISKFWNNSIPGSCWPPKVQQNTGYFQGAVCSAVDLALAAFPASMFWNLNMEWKKKVSLSCLMGLGVFAMIASIIKTVQLRAITAKADITYAMAQLAIWWTLEAYLVIIATSIPTLRPIMTPNRAGTRPRGSSIKRSTMIHSHQSSYGHSRQFERIEDSQLLESGSRMSTTYPGDAYIMEEGHSLDRNNLERLEGIEKTTTIGVTYADATKSDPQLRLGADFR